jgi:hypothetical protein
MTLIEKRILLSYQGSTKQIYTKGSDLFDENLNIKVSDLCKEVNQEDNKKRNPKSGEIQITEFHVRK